MFLTNSSHLNLHPNLELMLGSLNNFKVIGVSHHLASVELREKFALNDSEVTAMHQFLKEHTRGGFVLATCNRTEVYFVNEETQPLINQWAKLINVEPDFLRKYVYIIRGKEAFDYIFRVGTGLDSQILGDFQIIGQIKTAYQKAIADGADNKKITRLIDVLLFTSKRVKNETELSSGVASMAYSAIQHIQTRITDLSQTKALVYGAGKMGSAVVRKLAELMPTEQVMLANRTASRAEDVARKYGIKNVSEQNLVSLVEQSDFIISTPAVEEPLFSAELLKGVDLTGKIFVDLSMPRSVDGKLAEIEGVEILNLDELKDLQNETFELRKQSIPAAEKIVEFELKTFYGWIKSRELTPTIHALKNKLNVIKEVEMKRLQKDYDSINEEQLDAIATAIINKVTTQCIKHVKRNKGESLSLIQNIFEIDSNNG